MTEHEVQSLIDILKEAEAVRWPEEEVMNMLESRGRSCISANYIKKAKSAAKDAKNDREFLENLAKTVRMLKIEGDKVYMIYPKCYCHKLKGFEGDVPYIYCYCSVGWVKEMFEKALGKPVEVRLETSIRRGYDVCRLRVQLDPR